MNFLQSSTQEHQGYQDLLSYRLLKAPDERQREGENQDVRDEIDHQIWKRELDKVHAVFTLDAEIPE